jgi:hypothetical protein
LEPGVDEATAGAAQAVAALMQVVLLVEDGTFLLAEVSKRGLRQVSKASKRVCRVHAVMMSGRVVSTLWAVWFVLGGMWWVTQMRRTPKELAMCRRLMEVASGTGSSGL